MTFPKRELTPKWVVYEDELPEMTNEQFREAYKSSFVDIVRVYDLSKVREIIDSPDWQPEPVK